MALIPSLPSLSGWTPIRVGWDGPRPTLDWCLTRGIRFADPFFDQTIERCLRHPCRLLFQQRTAMEAAGRFVTDHPGLPLAGLIFHMSRCGSTLMAQMLAQASGNLVLSEAGPIDSVLRSRWDRVGPNPTDDERVTWLRWIVGALGQPRDADQQRVFVKFDAWSVIDLDIVRQAFPAVPWLFLYRDPIEVLMSHAGRRGAHTIPGILPPELLGMSPAEVASTPPVEYQARVLASICRAALERRDDPLGTFVEYGQLPGFVTSELPVICSMAWDPVDSDRMLQAATLDAKNPAIRFVDDRARKRSEASPAVREAAERWLTPLYHRLQDARDAGAQEQHPGRAR